MSDQNKNNKGIYCEKNPLTATSLVFSSMISRDITFDPKLRLFSELSGEAHLNREFYVVPIKKNKKRGCSKLRRYQLTIHLDDITVQIDFHS